MTQRALPNKFHAALNLYRPSVKRTAGITLLLTVFSLLFCPGYVIMEINRERTYANVSNISGKIVNFAEFYPYSDRRHNRRGAFIPFYKFFISLQQKLKRFLPCSARKTRQTAVFPICGKRCAHYAADCHHLYFNGLHYKIKIRYRQR